MTEKQLFRAVGSVDDDLVEQAAADRKPRLRVAAMKWVAAAACVALIAGVGILRLTATPQLLPRAAAAPEGRAMTFSSPVGIRKMLGYGGYRYAFLEDGAPYDLSGLSPTNALGTLDHDILAGMDGSGANEAADVDFSTTFALGGTVYELPGYNPAFRLAVALDGEYYLAQLVGRTDNVPLSAEYYFAVSDMESLVREVHILAHMGGEPLVRLKNKAQAKDMVRILSTATVAELNSEDYQAVASAQAEGRSWQLVLALADGTSVAMYVTPELGLISIGDDYYTLPEEFPAKYAPLFESLRQDAPPLY